MHRTMMIISIAIGIVFLSVLLLVRYLETAAVFFPGKNVFVVPSQVGMLFEDLYLSTDDGVRINAWFIPSKAKNPTPATIIFAHGNAGTMSDRMQKIKFFHELGLHVLAFDYRGYGKSQGRPTEKGIYRDALAVYDYLAQRPGIDPRRIIAYGSSLGGVVAVDLAVKRPVAALIVDSSITTAREAARLFYPSLPAFLMNLQFDSLGKVARIMAPKLFIHSPQDTVVPFTMGRRLFEAALAPKAFLTSSGNHNEVQIVTDPATAQALKKYLISQKLL